MNNKILKSLNLPQGIKTFFVPSTRLEVYSKENFKLFVNVRKRIFLSGSGFDNKVEAMKNMKVLKLIDKIALELSKYADVGIITGCCSDYSVSSRIVKRLKELVPNYPVMGISRYSNL
ncbi:MAG: hypothetical protein WCW13_07065, partial [archaeon]